MRRRQARRRNGRFTRNTAENTFGLHVEVCSVCRAVTTWDVGGVRPSGCHVCGGAFEQEARDEVRTG